ncbi:LOW QUALITY PROTEIN: putative transmembrane efflux protein [Geomicrobium sp. JCM 19055]|nr:LOW QUALITY PROTEIN: putative transmembrane efflux protein [Geomicrobium sp. JCM 19055]
MRCSILIGKFNRKIVLFVFMIGTFAIGMTEYVVTGLLTQFATDLHVEIATTGLLLSVYAISVAIFGPILRVITIKVNPKLLLICLTILFIVSNSIAAMAPNFEVLLLSRLLSAAMHAPFFGLCMSIAVAISSPATKTSALAAVNGGLTIAIMIGVPFGSYLGGMFDWRMVFLVIVVLGIITLLGLMIVTPNIKQTNPPSLKKELQIFKNKNVLLVIAIIVFGFSGVFTAYTFKEPILREYAGFDVSGITAALFFFGLGAVISNFLTGKIKPRLLTRSLMIALIVLGIVLTVFTTLIQISGLTLVLCFLFGMGTFGTTPILNSKIIISATEAPSLAGTIAASAFNLANAIGAVLGTVLLDAGFSYSTITYVASAIVFFGLLLTLLMNKFEDKSYFQDTH